eukprot:5660213-Amphidinium_carterae.1
MCRRACLAAQIENHAESEDEDVDDLSAPAAAESIPIASRSCQSTSVPSAMHSRFRSSCESSKVRWNTEPEQDASISATSTGLGVGMDPLDRAVAAPVQCSDRHHTPTLGLVGSWTG